MRLLTPGNGFIYSMCNRYRNYGFFILKLLLRLYVTVSTMRAR
jgi:hypothetical protein